MTRHFHGRAEGVEMDLQIVLPDESASMPGIRIIELGVEAERHGYQTLLRHLFANRGPFQGAHYGFDKGVFEPQPGEHLPIMVGGTSQRALRRAAQLADEWQGVGLEPDAFAAAVRSLRATATRPMRVGTRISWTGGAAELERAVDQAHSFAEAGADTLAVWFGAEDGLSDRMAEFAERVRRRTGTQPPP